MPPRRSPRLAELAASQRAESVPIALDDDDTESMQSTAVCAVCGDEGLRSSLVRIPCCDCLTHPMCVDDDIDAMCPYCSISVARWSTTEIRLAQNVVTQLIFLR